MGRQRGGRHEAVEYRIDTGTARLEPVPGDRDSWVLWVNGVPSSAITIGAPDRLDFEYLDWMSRVIEVALDTQQPRIVHIGAGACALPRWAADRYPQAKQTAVDIDSRLLTLVREWFDLPRAPRLALRAGDGAQQITTFPDHGLDVVVRDAFAGDATPVALTSREFFATVAVKLRAQGLFLANVADRPPHARLRAEITSLHRCFAHVALAADPGQVRGRRWGNVVAVASRAPLDTIAIAKALRRGPAQAALLEGARLRSYLGMSAK